jgi:hypothetical protein
MITRVTFGRWSSTTLWTTAHCSLAAPGGVSQRVSQALAASPVAATAAPPPTSAKPRAMSPTPAARDDRTAGRERVSPANSEAINAAVRLPSKPLPYQKSQLCQGARRGRDVGRFGALRGLSL